MSTLKTMLSSTPPPTEGDSFDMSWSPSSSASSQRDNTEELDKIFGLIRDITSLNKDQIERCMEDVETMIKRAAHKSKARRSSGGGSPSNRSHDNLVLLSPSAVTSTPRSRPGVQ